MSQKSKVFLHIGYHKTGTTSIQNFLSAQYLKLIEQGILYPKRMRHIDFNDKRSFVLAHHHFAWQFFKNPPLNKGFMVPENAVLATVRESNGCNCDKIIISSEAFSHIANIDSIQKIKYDLDRFDVKVVVYLRRQDRYIESYLNQLLKTGVVSIDSLDQMVQSTVKRYELVLNRYIEVFGLDNVIIKVFDDKEVKDDLINDFLRGIGVKDLSVFSEEDYKFENESLPLDIVLFIEELRPYLPENQYNEVFAYFRDYCRANGLKKSKGKILSAEQVRFIHDESVKMNARILKKYFKDQNRDYLFEWNLESDLKNYEQYKPVKYPQLVLKSIAELFKLGDTNGVRQMMLNAK